MKEETYAAIDIGSNAVRLLIKRAYIEAPGSDPVFKKLLLLRVPLRLGFDVFSKGSISEKKADNLLRLMKAYRQLIKIYEVDRLRACATSAMRDAANGPDIIRKIRKDTDIEIDIIAGEEEARIVYNNHIERGGIDNGSYLYVDVGGGSTELNFITDGRLLASRSFNIGTVRMLTGKVKVKELNEMRQFLDELHRSYPEITIIGSGGNINKLYKIAEEKDPATQSISVEELAHLYHTLKPMTVEERMREFGMRNDRADVVIPAAEIFLNIASVIKARRIIVPTIGVADGIIDGLYLAAHSGDVKN